MAWVLRAIYCNSTPTQIMWNSNPLIQEILPIHSLSVFWWTYAILPLLLLMADRYSFSKSLPQWSSSGLGICIFFHIYRRLFSRIIASSYQDQEFSWDEYIAPPLQKSECDLWAIVYFLNLLERAIGSARDTLNIRQTPEIALETTSWATFDTSTN